MNKKLLMPLVFLVVILAVVFVAFNKFTIRNSNVVMSTSRLATSSRVTNIDNYSEYVGIISTSTDGQNIYTSKKYGLQFEYPQGWYLDDNGLGYSTIQLFNYDYLAVQRGELKSQKGNESNKIEASVGEGFHYYGTSDIYPEKTRTTKNIEVAGQPAIREFIILQDGSEILFYLVPLPDLSDQYLGVSMYGNSSNFPVLDQMMNTLTWIR